MKKNSPEQIKDCECHCHLMFIDGVEPNCKCIKNCIHCHPENFKSEQINSWETDYYNFLVNNGVTKRRAHEAVGFVKYRLSKQAQAIIQKLEEHDCSVEHRLDWECCEPAAMRDAIAIVKAFGGIK